MDSSPPHLEGAPAGVPPANGKWSEATVAGMVFGGMLLVAIIMLYYFPPAPEHFAQSPAGETAGETQPYYPGTSTPVPEVFLTESDNPWAVRCGNDLWCDSRNEIQRLEDASRVRIPDNPSPDDYREYIRRITYCIQKQLGCVSVEEGFATLLLSRVGRDNIFLLNEMADQPGARYELINARNMITGAAFFPARKPDEGPPARSSHWTPQLSGTYGLPAKPTRNNYRNYIARIIARRQNDHWSLDTILARDLLMEVGEANIDLLLEALNNEPSQAHYDLLEAVERLAAASNRHLIVAALPRCHDLLALIMERHWENDAADTIVAVFRNNPDDLRPDWFYAVASLRDPANNPLLEKYLLRRYRPRADVRVGNLTIVEVTNVMQRNESSLLYFGLQLIAEDERRLIATVWQVGNSGKPRHADELALLAMREGQAGALGYFLDEIKRQPRWRSPGDTTDEQEAIVSIDGNCVPVRILLQSFVDYNGDSAGLADWYRANQDRLVFNRTTQRYCVRP